VADRARRHRSSLSFRRATLLQKLADTALCPEDAAIKTGIASLIIAIQNTPKGRFQKARFLHHNVPSPYSTDRPLVPSNCLFAFLTQSEIARAKA
jgi:hypothetical protein